MEGASVRKEYLWGRVVINTFGDLYLRGADFIRHKGGAVLVFDLGYYSIGFVLKRSKRDG